MPRHTYLNIKEKLFYTINSVQKNFAGKAHHTSAKYKRNISEFDITKLEAQYINNFIAPYVKLSSIKIGMKFVEEIKINYNKSRLIVGKIVELNVEDDIISKDGFINLNESQIATISGCDGYSFPIKNEKRIPKTQKDLKKTFLPQKICPVCNFSFSWRKKWKKRLGKCDLL